MDAPWWKAWETVPGALALVGVVGGYARMGQRVKALEAEMETMSPLKDQVARIDERTKAMDKRSERIEDKVDRLLQHTPFRRPERRDG